MARAFSWLKAELSERGNPGGKADLQRTSHWVSAPSGSNNGIYPAASPGDMRSTSFLHIVIKTFQIALNSDDALTKRT